MATTARLLPHLLVDAGSRRAGLPHRRLIIISDEPLCAAELRSLFPRLESAVFVYDAEAAASAPGSGEGLRIDHAIWCPQTPDGFDAQAQRVLRRSGVAAFLKPHVQCSGRMLRDLRRCGVRTAIFDECGRWSQVGITRAIAAKVRLDRFPRRMHGRAVPVLVRIGAAVDRSVLSVVRAVIMNESLVRRGADEEAVARFHEALSRIEEPQPPRRQVKRILHYVSSLDSGGAERQVVHVAKSQHQRGLEVCVRTQSAVSGPRAHYLPMLVEGGVTVRQAGAVEVGLLASLAQRLAESPGRAHSLRCVPPTIRAGVLDILGEVMLERPDVLHCWLDEPNILGAVAGLLAGVRRIVISTRNVNPSRFPHLYRTWMRPWYRFLASRPEIVFAGNSRAGIIDYAAWLGIDPARFMLLRNAAPSRAFANPPLPAVKAIRREAGACGGVPLVVGVMRLSIEKRPDLFVETIRRVRLVKPDCRAAIAGVGPLEGEVRRQIASLRLDHAITLLGQRRDVNAILAAADVVLLTSDHEGTPNVLLEALALGRAVVATDAGGVGEVIEHDRTGLLAECGDVGALAAAVNRVLTDSSFAEQLAAAGREIVRERFSLDAVVDQTLAAYVI